MHAISVVIFFSKVKKNLFAVLLMFVDTIFHLFQLLTTSGNIFQSTSDAQETALEFSRSPFIFTCNTEKFSRYC